MNIEEEIGLRRISFSNSFSNKRLDMLLWAALFCRLQSYDALGGISVP
jgi:hypothetical protein